LENSADYETHCTDKMKMMTVKEEEENKMVAIMTMKELTETKQ
jgi:hypothetical protein